MCLGTIFALDFILDYIAGVTTRAPDSHMNLSAVTVIS